MWIRSRGVTKCSGPYHAATASGSVQALNTRSRGASKMRVIRTSWSLILRSFPAQVRLEPIHPSVPRSLALLHPLDRVVERLGTHLARPPLGFPATNDQPGLLEHLQVPRDRRQAHLEGLRKLADGRLALSEPGQDRAARRVGEGGEGESELVGGHITDRLINVAIKYHPPLRRN